MTLFEGKTTTERNKIIAAALLGVVALFSLYMAFGGGFGPSATATTTTKVTVNTPRTSTGTTTVNEPLPTADQQDFVDQTTPVVYQPGNSYAPDAGRNIFAFYEPPPPCRGAGCPTPLPPPIRTPIPPPPPTPYPFALAWANPVNVYAGSPGFKLELGGDRFTPEVRAYFNQVELPTTVVSPQKLIVDVPASMITQEGPVQLLVQTPDGKLISNPGSMTVQPPPKPGLTYIGMIARKRGNNDTAYFTETGKDKDKPFGARLSDVLGGRFRLVDISAAEVVFEDVNLGFRHRLPISKAVASAGSGSGSQPPGRLPSFNDGGFQPFDPSTQRDIPGIPNSIPRYVPPPAPQQQIQPNDRRQPDKKDDVDDDGER